MVFSSLTFLFVFLPLVLAAYYVCPRRGRNTVLLAASLLFYAWGEGWYVGLMLVSLVMNYWGGLLIERRRERGAKWVLGWFAVLNLGLLAGFKYANFLTDNLNSLREVLGWEPWELDPVHLPIGISFFTFQALSYLVDVYRQEAPVQRNFLNIALYISLFPQLVAGPIVRYHDVARQIVDRCFRSEDFAAGVRRFILGLGKKVLIANVMGATADAIFALPSQELAPSTAWLGAVCYAFQIYFDFSGYSDMAIGLGRMFGFKFLENFNYPYVSQSIQEFWRRWHMSLSNWFRDYLYIPLGGNRVSARRVYWNLTVVFFLCGLWHGASWNFVIWGLLHGAFLVIERLGLPLKRLPRVLRHVYVLLAVLTGWIFFRIETLSGALDFLGTMWQFSPGSPETIPMMDFLNLEVALVLGLATLGSMPLAARLETWRNGLSEKPLPAAAWTLAQQCYVWAVFLLCVTWLTANTYNPFIYFRF